MTHLLRATPTLPRAPGARLQNLEQFCPLDAAAPGDVRGLASQSQSPKSSEDTPACDRRDEAGRRLPPRRGGGDEPPRQPRGGRLLGAGAVRRDAAEPVRGRVRGEGLPDGRLLRQAQVPRGQLPVPVQGRRQPEAPRRHQAQAEGVHRLQGARAELLVALPPSAARARGARARRREPLHARGSC